MIETAVRLLQRDGYRSTSWRRVVREAGTPWGSAHHYFPGGKEQLGVAAVTAGAEMIAAAVAHCFASCATPADAISQLFALSAARLEASDFGESCPIAGVALQIGSADAQLSAACAGALQRWRGIVEDHLMADGHEPARAAELATIVLTGLEGALLVARTLRSTDPLFVTGRYLAEVLRRN